MLPKMFSLNGDAICRVAVQLIDIINWKPENMLAVVIYEVNAWLIVH